MFNITPKIKAEVEQLGIIEQLLSQGQPVTFDKDEYIIRAGDPVERVFFMQSGLVKCFYIHEDKEVILRLMTDGSAVTAYSGAITGEPSSEFIQCLQPCSGISISSSAIESYRQQHPQVELLLRYVAEQHYLSLERRQMMLHHKKAQERYRYFCEVMDQKIVEETPAQFIASYLGLTPESFSRVKRQLNN